MFGAWLYPKMSHSLTTCLYPGFGFFPGLGFLAQNLDKMYHMLLALLCQRSVIIIKPVIITIVTSTTILVLFFEGIGP